MFNGEALCKRLVQAAITGKRTPDQLRNGAEKSLKAIKADFAKDGDMDKLKFTKYLFAKMKGAAGIAEAPPDFASDGLRTACRQILKISHAK